MDDVNALLKMIEEALKDRYRVRARVLLCEESAKVARWIAFGKLANEWCIVLETWRNGELVDQGPLSNMAAHYRLAMVDKLDELRAALEKAQTDQEELARRQVKKAEEFLTRLKGDDR